MLSVYTGFDGVYYHHSGGPGIGLGPWAQIIHGPSPSQHFYLFGQKYLLTPHQYSKYAQSFSVPFFGVRYF